LFPDVLDISAYSVAAFFVEWFKNRHVFHSVIKKATDAMRRLQFFLLPSVNVDELMITADLDPSLLSIRSNNLNKVADCVQNKVMEALELYRVETMELTTTPTKKRKRTLQPTMGGVSDRLKGMQHASLTAYAIRVGGRGF
jgi:hypothetical protein